MTAFLVLQNQPPRAFLEVEAALWETQSPSHRDGAPRWHQAMWEDLAHGTVSGEWLWATLRVSRLQMSAVGATTMSPPALLSFPHNSVHYIVYVRRGFYIILVTYL